MHGDYSSRSRSPPLHSDQGYSSLQSSARFGRPDFPIDYYPPNDDYYSRGHLASKNEFNSMSSYKRSAPGHFSNGSNSSSHDLPSKRSKRDWYDSLLFKNKKFK